MRWSAVAILLSLLSYACGPHCDNASDRADFVGSCEGAGSGYGYCSCFADYVFARYACDDFANLSETDAKAACEECAPPNGETCNL